MFKDFFSKTFYYNTVSEWALSIGIIVLGALIAKITYWVIGKYVKKFTAKSKTRLDDILVDMVEEPIVFSIIIWALWYAIKRLDLPEWLVTYDGITPTGFVNKVYYVLIIFNAAWLINRLFDALIKEYVLPLVRKSESDLDDQLLPILRKGFKTTVWTIAIIVALNNAGYDVGAVLAGLGIGGLALALAAQDSVANLFGGFMIFADRPFTINERIKISGFDGTVTEVGLRSTRLKTLEGRMVTIPNSTFSKGIIENVSSEPSRKVAMTLGLTYDMSDAEIEKAINLLKEIAAGNESLEQDSYIGFTGFGDFSLNVLFIYFIKKEGDILNTQTAINLEIMRKFKEHSLEFAFPTQTIHTKQIN